MRDYEELVKRLHKRIASTTAGSPLQDDLLESADAIEELQKSVELEYQSGFADGQISANRKKNRWISVEEKMPDVNERVLACVSSPGEPLVWDAVRWNGEEWESEEEAAYEYWTPIELPVTHWMPLPEPPMEVKA